MTLEQGTKMSDMDQNAPTGKPGRRKGKKEKKNRVPDQAMSPRPEDVYKRQAQHQARDGDAAEPIACT